MSTGLDMRWKGTPELLPPRHDFYKQKSENRSRYEIERPTCSCWPRVTIFTSGKPKTDLDTSWKGPPAAVAPALRFLRAEKRKQYERPARSGYMSRIIFLLDKYSVGTGTSRASYFRWENRYLQPARPQVQIAPHIFVR